MAITFGLLDDQHLVRQAMTNLINSFANFEVLYTSDSGEDFLNKLKACPNPPDVLLVDVLLGDSNSLSTVAAIKKYAPTIKIVALSGLEDSTTVVKMVRAGCCAYLSKNTKPEELEYALNFIYKNGYYNGHLNHIGIYLDDDAIELGDRELQFLELAASDLNYNEIAEKMFLSVKTVDGYRAKLFDKFRVKSRVGLVLEAARRKIIYLQ